MERLRLALVTETYPPEVNGVARTVARIVAELCRRGHDVRLVRPQQGRADRALAGPGYAELLRPGLPIPRYPQLRLGLPSRRRLARWWRTDHPDLVHIVTEGPLGWSALAAARRLGIPATTAFHTNFHAYSGHYGCGWLARAVTAYLRRFHNRAACTMVPTDELAAELGRLGFERLRVAGRGVDTAVFSPARRSAERRRHWGADERTPVALCVSRFAREKNLPLVIESFRAMRAARPDTKLVLVGDGPLLPTLRAQRLGPVIAGRLVNGALSEHYASADIFLFPSLTETFGNVTLEAMASGLGVVAYDYAAARQHIVHGHTGLLAPRDDQTAFIGHAMALASGLENARTLGRRARETAEQLSWERVIDDFEAILRDAVATGSLPAHRLPTSSTPPRASPS